MLRRREEEDEDGGEGGRKEGRQGSVGRSESQSGRSVGSNQEMDSLRAELSKNLHVTFC